MGTGNRLIAGGMFYSRNVRNLNVFSDCDHSNTEQHGGVTRDSFNRDVNARLGSGLEREE